mgnify:CR=1 FL=1
MSANERGLGRGLDALFRNVTPAERPSSAKVDSAEVPAPSVPKNTTTLPIAALTPWKDLDMPLERTGTAHTIFRLGVCPGQTDVGAIRVQMEAEGLAAELYEIVAGERRWRAAQRAGLTEVPVYLRELSDEDALTAALIENLQREDLNPLEEAQAIQSLRERLPYSQEELAQRLGKSRSAVANSLRLLQLPRPMQDALKDGVFTPGHARAVLALPERALQDILFNAVMTRRLSVRDAEEAVIHWKRHGLLPSSLMGASAPVARSARAPKPACIKLAIRQLRENVAPKASISGTDRAGRITLPYESEEQLAELLSRLGLSVELSEAKPE